MRKWSEEQIAELKDLCYTGVSNKEIAEKLGRKVTEIYNKRSQLGITIDKCFPEKAEKKQKKTERKKIEHPGLSKKVKKAFRGLNDALLLEIANDWTNEKDAKIYARLAETLISLEDVYNKLIKRR